MDLRRLFEPQTSSALERRDIGHVYLTTNQIMCADPFRLNGPILHGFDPGPYPVSLWFKDEPSFGRRVAFAAVTFSREPPTSFFEAVYRTENASSSGVEVHSGLAAFMDARVAATFSDLVDRYNADHPEGSFYEARLAREFARSATSPGHAGAWAIHHPIADRPDNIVMFASGLGDGCYRVMWGESDRADAPLICLVVDFDLCGDD